MFTIPRKPASTSITSLRGLTAGEDALLSELQKINAALSSQPVAEQTLSSFKANTLLQFLGILAATVFGVFSILAWLAATKSNEISSNALSQALQSNQLALQSNQLALLAYCVSSGNSTSAAAICANVLSQASGEFAPIVASALPSVQTSASVTSVTSTTSSTTSVLSTSTTLPTSSGSPFSAGSSSIQVSESAAASSTTSLAIITSSIFLITPSAPASAGFSSPATTASIPAPTAPLSAGAAPSSGTDTANVAAIVGGVVGAVAAIAIVLLYIWRRRAYKEMLGRSHPQEREKFSEGM